MQQQLLQQLCLWKNALGLGSKPSASTVRLGIMTTLLFLASIVHSCSIGSAFVRVHTNAFKRSSSVGAYNIGQGDSAEGGDDATSSKSIDDYVLNVHGGKYRFDDPSSIGSAAGQDFAQSLYSSSSTIEADIAAAEEEQRAAADYNRWPNWAKRMVTNKDRIKASIENAVEVSESNSPAVVTIHNQYRTWEPYYARIVRFDANTDEIDIDPATCPYMIIATHGKLAPNGGVDGYSDSASISVQTAQREQKEEGESWFLVVGTEEEQWYYQLIY